MLKLVFLALTLAAANAASFGGWEQGTVAEVQDLALWSTQQLAGLSGFEGEYTIQTPKNVQKQVVNGINYKFTLDVVVRYADGKYTFQSCDLAIYEQAWSNTRKFIEAPVCKTQQNKANGGWQQGSIAEVQDLALWSVQQFAGLSGFEGEYTIQTPKNVQKQVVNGVNYKFTLDVVVRGADGKYTFQSCDLAIYEQAWTNTRKFLEAPVCKGQTKKAGGWSQGSVAEVQDLALWSTQQLAGMSGFEGEYTIQTPKNVQKQVVNGINYKFTLDVVVRDAEGKYTFQSCDMFINEQTWTNTRKFVEAPVCKSQQTRAGGWVPVKDVTDEILDVARLSVDLMTTQMGLVGIENNVNRLLNVQRQVVNGINYKFTVEYIVRGADNSYNFKLCDMAVNYKAWQSTNQLTFIEQPSCKDTDKRDANDMTGGWSQGNIAEVQDLALWSTQQLAGMSGFEGEYTIQTPKNVQKQVVNGVNYKFTLDVVVRDAEGKYTFKSCDMFIFEQTWSKTRQFVEAPVCKTQQKRAGGWISVDAITDEVMDMARLSAKQMSTQLGLVGDYNVHSISNVRRQVVNGINYKFTVEYLVARPDNKYGFKVCDLAVNYKAWQSTNQISFIEEPTCQDSAVNKAVDGWTGGWTQQDTVTDDVMSLARWATSQLSTYTGVQGTHTVMSARNVQTQIVAGVNYKFTLDVVANDAETGKYSFQTCDLTIFTQSWSDVKQITSAKCGPNPQFQ